MTKSQISEGESYQVFISYARPDAEFASSLYEWLKGAGFDVWLDTKNLKPGQNWDFEIDFALQRSSFIIILLSKNSVDRRGYVQREIKVAIDKYKEKLVDDIFIIPVLIDDDVIVPRDLQSIQYIASSTPAYENAIADAINTQIERLGGERKKLQEGSDVYWSFTKKREVWDGLPGYEYEAQFTEFTSGTYANLSDISHIIRGYFLDDLFRLRKNKLIQSSEAHSFAEDRWSRTDTFHASCSEPVIVNRVLGVKYLVDWYGAGAAHPNHHFATFSFVLDPLCWIRDLREIFDQEDAAFSALTGIAIDRLLADKTDDGEPILDEGWVRSGLADWDAFSAFVFRKEGIELLFPPYRVGPYAAGSFAIVVPYTALIDFIVREYKIALGIEHLRTAA